VLAHHVATVYLADMLLGAGRPETDELPIARVAFQTNPDPVDDLRVEARRNDDNVVVHVAVRRSPNFVKSHTKTAELVGTLLDQVATFEPDQRAYVAVALVAMSNPHRQVQQLASLARGRRRLPAHLRMRARRCLVRPRSGQPHRRAHRLQRGVRPPFAIDQRTWVAVGRRPDRTARVASAAVDGIGTSAGHVGRS